MNTSFKQSLKAQAHSLKPVVLLGIKGLTHAVIAQTDEALLAHELIKIKISGTEREDRKNIVKDICAQLQADLVQLIGNIAILYRKNAP